MAKSEAWYRANNKWMAKAYYRQIVNFKKENEEAIRQRAEELGVSVSAYITKLVDKDLESHIL